MRKIAIIIFILMMSLPCTSAVQSGWLDWDQVATGATLGTAGADEWWIFGGNSVNQHIGRDGIVTGAYVKMNLVAQIRGDGAFFGVFRLVSGKNYTLIGRSQGLSSSDLSIGLNTITFDTPITDVRSTDMFGMCANATSNAKWWVTIDDGDVYAADDSLTAKSFWLNTGSATAPTVGTDYNLLGGGTLFLLFPFAPIMDDPKVIVVGDSISEGSSINFCYRNDFVTKSRTGAFAYVAYRDKLNWTVELAGNKTVSNNAAQVISDDLATAGGSLDSISVWAKSPEYLHVHVGVNDINDGRSLNNYLADLDTILGLCITNNAKLILTSIFPWTGNAGNTTGTDAQNRTRDTWNIALVAWAKNNNVIWIDLSTTLGKERTVAKGVDPAPPAGNLWDLQAAYVQADGLGVHLSEAGCAAAGESLASGIKAAVMSKTRNRYQNGYRANYRARYKF